MDIFGYFVYMGFCLVVTLYCSIGIIFGGTDLSPAKAKLAMPLAIIIMVTWYFAYRWFPFEVSVK